MRAWLWTASAIGILAAAAAVYLAARDSAPVPPIATAAADPAQDFLARHWPDPLPAQGEPPPGYSTLEASLDPQACGRCHARQLSDWASSLHSRTMGPGIRWQFYVLGQKAANRCLRCHAPLAEQKALLAIERRWENAPAAEPPAYVTPNLHLQGLVCAACHVRQHARFGPPARPETSPMKDRQHLPHGGFSASAGFEDSRFCAVCHQFGPEGARLNGKPLENTFEEWRSSAAARQGRSCQSCHMPGRRHLWRGIHDADMVRQALGVSLEVRSRGGRGILAEAELANVGAGHHFPTYLIAEVVAILELVDAGGTVRAEIARHVIGRRANLELTEESADTRIAAGEKVRFTGEFPSPAAGSRVQLRVMVYPGKHYERLFRSELERRRDLRPEAEELLKEALQRAESSSYELYRIARALPRDRAPAN